jgi:hypothetical protein
MPASKYATHLASFTKRFSLTSSPSEWWQAATVPGVGGPRMWVSLARSWKLDVGNDCVGG